MPDEYLRGYRNGRLDRMLGLRLFIAWSAPGDYGAGYRAGWLEEELNRGGRRRPAPQTRHPNPASAPGGAGAGCA